MNHSKHTQNAKAISFKRMKGLTNYLKVHCTVSYIKPVEICFCCDWKPYSASGNLTYDAEHWLVLENDFQLSVLNILIHVAQVLFFTPALFF